MSKTIDLSSMRNKYGNGDRYTTEPGTGASPQWPSLLFYAKLLFGPVSWLCLRGRKGQCDDISWVYGSAWCADILEELGGRMEIEGLSQLGGEGPKVFIANHMSTLETFFLPAVLRPHGPVTFVVKRSLTTVPFFGHVMRSREPVVVDRMNPREDLAAVLNEGSERLARGISIVVFPQSTRSLEFSREHFNSIGIKLARKAQVPVIPVALKTDAWGMGRKIKELGKFRPGLPVRFKFGPPMRITGNGKEDHEGICRFIEENLKKWSNEDGINK